MTDPEISQSDPLALLGAERSQFRGRLQTLDSIINLHARHVAEPKARRIFDDLRRRLEIQAQIYAVVDAAPGDMVPLPVFFAGIAPLLERSLGFSDSRGLKLDIQDFSLPRGRCVLLAQLAAEVLTLIPHAAETRGAVSLTLSPLPAGRAALTLSAEGWPGPPGGAEPADALRRVMIASLAEGLGGRLEFTAPPAGGIFLDFPLHEG